MGYATLITLDDDVARETREQGDTKKFLEAWCEVATVGSNAYELLEPWGAECIGRFHSSETTFFQVKAKGFTLVNAQDWEGTQTGSWRSGKTMSQLNRWISELQDYYQRLGEDPTMEIEADRDWQESLKSVWWLYHDALGRVEQLKRSAKAFDELLDDGWSHSLSMGCHANAINRAGSMFGPGDVNLVWNGNRVTSYAGLLPEEIENLGVKSNPEFSNLTY